MAENETIIPLSEVIKLPDGSGVDKVCVAILREEEIPVVCFQKGVQKKVMPFQSLYNTNERFWEQSGGGWTYYLTQAGFVKLREKVLAKEDAWNLSKLVKAKPAAPQTLDLRAQTLDLQAGGEKETALTEAEKNPADAKVPKEEAPPKAEMGYGDEYKVFAEMSAEKRVAHLQQGQNRLSELYSLQTDKDTKYVAEAIVDVAQDTMMINHVVLEDARNYSNNEAKILNQGLVDSTNEVVEASIQLSSKSNINDELLNDLMKKSNGTISQHTTRVHMRGMKFLLYYNALVETGNLIQKLRISFANKYRRLYHMLLAHYEFEEVTLERVFYGGMRSIPEKLMNKWCIGFLLHDIGKVANVEYHEGEGAYNRDIVMEHVQVGYDYIANKTTYAEEVGFIVGQHHEYYDDDSGYGYYRENLRQNRVKNPSAKQDYCISYELEPIQKCMALAYFPAKVLEIIDVHDSLTDPNRIYRKAVTSDEAIAMMREEFILKRLKLDPILFDIFVAYLRRK